MKKIFSIVMAAALSLTASAQDLHSSYFMQTSNQRHEMNPALLDSAYISMPLLLGNLNLGTTGNIGLKNFIYDMQPSWQGYGTGGRKQTTFMHPNISAEQFLDNLNDNNRFGLGLKYQLLGVGFKAFGGTNVIELNLRSVTEMNLPKTLFEFMKVAGAKTDYQMGDFGLRTENFVELGLGHSHKVNEQITVGAKAKLLVGIGYADLSVNQLDIHLAEEQWKLQGDIQSTVAIGSSTLEYEDADKNYVDPTTGQQTSRRRISGIDEVKPGISGIGLAFDLGATYKPVEDLTLSLGVTDLGFMKWKKALYGTSAGTWTFDGFKNPIYVGGSSTDTGDNKIEDQIDAIGDDLGDMFSLYEAEKPEGTETRSLAMTVNVGAEYAFPMYRNLRFGLLYSGRMAGRYAWHQGMLSATVRPVKWFEATINATVSSAGLTGGMVVDFRANHFNIFLGTDRFFSKLSKQCLPINHGNSNLTLGLSFPL